MKKLLFALALFASSVSAQVRLDVANNGTYTDSKGNVWVSDVGSYVGTNAISTCVPNPTTAGTPDPTLFKTQRFGTGNGTAAAPYLTYTIKALRPGQYTVNLYFSECSFGSAGARTFNVALQSIPILTNFDIFVAAGNKQNTAVIKSFPAVVGASGQLILQFTPGTANNPIVAAIEILPAGDVTPPVVSIVSPALGTIKASTFIQVNATDDVKVVTVAGTIDGVAMVLTASNPPLYTFSTDLATLPLGNHVLAVSAKDLAGNTGTASMNFSNVMTIGLVAMPTPHQVTLTWIVPTVGPSDPNPPGTIPTGYNVYRKLSTDAAYPATPLASVGSTNTYIDTAIGAGLSYVYKVTGTNPNGVPPESVPSNEVTVTIPTP